MSLIGRSPGEDEGLPRPVHDTPRMRASLALPEQELDKLGLFLLSETGLVSRNNDVGLLEGFLLYLAFVSVSDEIAYGNPKSQGEVPNHIYLGFELPCEIPAQRSFRDVGHPGELLLSKTFLLKEPVDSFY